MISIIKILHRGEYRIKIVTALSPTSKQKVKEIIGRKWSQTLISWHLPYTKTAYKELLKKFGKENIQVLKSQLDKPTIETKNSDSKLTSHQHKEDVIFDFKEKVTQEYLNAKVPQWGFYRNKKGEQIKFVAGHSVIVNQLNSRLIAVYIPAHYSFALEIVRKMNGRKWNNHEKYWSFPFTQESIDQLQQIDTVHFNFKLNIPKQLTPSLDSTDKNPKSIKLKSYDKLNRTQKLAITKLEEMLMLERKSVSTIKTYRYHLVDLFHFYPMSKPSQITNEQLKDYMLKKIKVNNIKSTTQGQILNAFVAFYKRLLKQEGHLTDLIRPKKKQSLPNIFSKDEVKKLFDAVTNLKHKSLLMLVYSAGLRKSEVRNLRKNDILFSRKCIFIKDSKGNKDRYVLLAEKAIKYLKPYLKEYRPKYWLFEGNNAGQYSETSIQKIFTTAKIKAKVNPYVTFHGLRHSFATHSIENGVPLHVVKELLGHHSLKTTQVYLHISDKFRKELKSPLDELDL